MLCCPINCSKFNLRMHIGSSNYNSNGKIQYCLTSLPLWIVDLTNAEVTFVLKMTSKNTITLEQVCYKSICNYQQLYHYTTNVTLSCVPYLMSSSGDAEWGGGRVGIALPLSLLAIRCSYSKIFPLSKTILPHLFFSV